MKSCEDAGLEDLIRRASGRVADNGAYAEGLDALLSWCAFLLPSSIPLQEMRSDALTRHSLDSEDTLRPTGHTRHRRFTA